ncbi:MAG TPA: hypothetical protein VKY89_01320 [Thermoanaerobaculia bacterium]|nr:hypothetical protein [Thermoanaerobaculia bacterium]
MKRHLVLTLAAVAAAIALVGCFDVEQSVSLQRDLSGTASFSMTIDLEPMIVFMVSMQHSMSGKEGEPTPAEIDQARKSFLEQQKKDPAKQKQETAAQQAQLEQTLPAGVKLLSSSVEDHGTKVAVRCQFGFDDVRKLAKIKLPEKGGAGQPGKNPFSDPFSSLQITDEGPTLLLTIGGGSPAARLQEQAAKDGAAATPEMSKALEGAFKGARFAFRLDSPFEVVETNATRRDGRTLYWEVRATDPNATLPQTLTARLKK